MIVGSVFFNRLKRVLEIEGQVMWLIEAVSWLVGPTVGGIVDTIIACAFGIFILLWNISPLALAGFIIILVLLSTLSGKLGTFLFGLCAAYAAFYYGHPIIAVLFTLYTLKEMFSSEAINYNPSSTENEEKKSNGIESNSSAVQLSTEPVTYNSPVIGTIYKVFVKPSTFVKSGAVLIQITTDEGIIDITAPKDGIVYNIFVIIGSAVQKGTPLFLM